MNIILSTASGDPMYSQIKTQIKMSIIHGELAAGEALPSIRGLAKDLHISVITIKKAYEELEREGLIETVAGKGSFVAGQNTDLLQEKQRKLIQDKLEEIVQDSRQFRISLAELVEMLQLLYEE